MLIRFFFMLREGGLKVSITEFLTLLEVLEKRIAGYSVEEFYYLARACLVKDEALYDRFDRVFSAHFKGIQDIFGEDDVEIPEDWLRRQYESLLSDEEKAMVESLGGWDKLMETLRKRLEEQESRHEGGNKWIGTGGTSPFGVELGTRNMKVALRRLRKFAREGAADELDLPDTIESTARNAGLLDIKMVPERHNAVKVLLFLDAGGSMDDHVRVCEELFSAASGEFKHLEYFYFHNCVYEGVWKDNARRHSDRTPLMDVLHKYSADYKLILVGDATMSPYEIHYPGGSVEHWNEEAGASWMKRLLDTYPKAIWLNPEPVQRWEHTPSIRMISELMEERMYPLTVNGLEQGMRALR
jgi:uncharacterized protein with von Willebrand factor type A (vWA) domain